LLSDVCRSCDASLADKHNLRERLRLRGGDPEHACNNKCQRTQTSVSTPLCITPHAVDRDFQARKQESVTLACGLNQGRFRGAIRPPACCRHHSLTQYLHYKWSIIDCYRSDTARKTVMILPGYMPCHASQCSCMLVLVRMRVTVSGDRRAGQSGSGSSNHSQVVGITHSCSHRNTMMLEEGQSGSTAFLSVAGQSRERGGTSVVMILLLPTTAS
jgi:hypothetical protein